MLSLAAMFAVLSYAAPASAELKIGGEAAVRARAEFNDTTGDDLLYQYRIRLNTSADLGDGYFFKAMMQNEEVPSAWTTMIGGPAAPYSGLNNREKYAMEISNFYFGRNLKDCSYSIGRLPLNSFNNPIFDLALYAVPTVLSATSTVYAVDIPVTTYNFDRLFGANYSRKIGDGTFNGTLVVMDNSSTKATDNGFLNDGYALHLGYKTTVGDVTVEPQALLSLTNIDLAKNDVSPQTIGVNATIPSGKAKVGVSAFYTICDDTTPANADVDYTGYLVRLKGESGNAMAWIDYNATSDQSGANDADYDNLFVWAQYKFKMHESATGTFTLTPTLRYRASGAEGAGAVVGDNEQLRAELYAAVTF